MLSIPCILTCIKFNNIFLLKLSYKNFPPHKRGAENKMKVLAINFGKSQGECWNNFIFILFL